MITCQHCGTVNPATNLRCIHCGQALSVPVTQSAPLAQAATELPAWLLADDPPPSAPAQAAPNNVLPSWLVDVGVEDSLATAAPTASSRDDTLPDWLQSFDTPEPVMAVQETSSLAPPADLPAWLFDDTAAAPPVATAPTTTIPNWLQGDVPGDQATPITASPATNDLPAWLLEDVPPPATNYAASPTTQPDWLPTPTLPNNALPEVVAPSANDRYVITDDLPSWLRSPQADSGPAAPVVDGDELPSWLRDDDPLPSEPRAEAMAQLVADDLPDWMRSDTPVSTEQTLVATEDHSDLPAWLRDDEAPTPATVPVASTANALPSWLTEVGVEDAPPATAPAANDVLPAWLRDDEAPPTTMAATSDDVLPDWLATTEPPALAVSTAATDELPAWLREADAMVAPDAGANADAQPATGATTALPAWLMDDQAVVVPVPPTPQAADDLPVWLRDDAPSTNVSMGLTTEPASLWTPLANLPQVDSTDAATAKLPAWLRDDDAQATMLDEAQTSPVVNQLPAPPSDTDVPTWLQEATDQLPVAAAPSATTNALPDWLRDDGTSAPVPLASQASPDELPAWLQGDAPTAPAPATPSQSAADDDLPAWLRDDNGVAPAAAQAHAPALADDLPAWLRDDALITPVVKQATATPSSAPTADDLPAWLRDNTPTAPPTTQATAATPSAAATELPDWLRGDPSAVPPVAAAVPQATTDDLPAWLRDDAPVVAAALTTEPLPTAGADNDLPAWLQAGTDEGARVYDAPTDTPLAPTEARVYDVPPAADALPAWLADFDAPTPAPASSPVPSWLEARDETPPTQTNELLGNLDLPVWLRETAQREDARAIAQPATPPYLDAPAAERDPMPVVAPVVMQPRTLARSPERVEAVALLERMRGEPVPEPVRVAPARRRSRIVPILQVLAVILVVAAILAALLGPRLFNLGLAPQPDIASITPHVGGNAAPLANGAAGVTRQINTLALGQPVLVAYEWDARRAAEMEPLANAVLGQLAARHVPIMLISTDPQGSLLAADAANTLAVGGDPFYKQGGTGVFNLGFKPGGMLALARLGQQFDRVLAQDAAGHDLRANQQVIQTVCGVANGAASACRLDHLGMVVVLVDEQSDVQSWIEQVHAAAPSVPLLIATPAEVAPLARPYVTDASISLIAGLGDAQVVGANVDERIGRRLDATAVGGATVGALALLGAFPAIISGRRARRRGEQSAWDR